jgi:hypothetical protein
MLFFTSNTARMRISSNGNVGIGTTGPGALLDISGTSGGTNSTITLRGGGTSAYTGIDFYTSANSYVGTIAYGNSAVGITAAQNNFMIYHANQNLVFVGSGANERMRITSAGNVRIGPSGIPLSRLEIGGSDLCFSSCNASSQILMSMGTSASTFAPNASDTVMNIGRSTTTSRSINATGTVNTNGADYAEYMFKDENSGTFSLSKGDIAGVTSNGLLTTRYDESITFVVKSTEPSFVGGDNWTTLETVGVKPTPISSDSTQEEKDAYDTAMIEFNNKLETQRQKVDRISFSGQVPVNVYGALPGDYIVPISNVDGTIGGSNVSQPNITFDQYRCAVGKVIKTLDDGRAFCIVKII